MLPKTRSGFQRPTEGITKLKEAFSTTGSVETHRGEQGGLRPSKVWEPWVSATSKLSLIKTIFFKSMAKYWKTVRGGEGKEPVRDAARLQ